MVQGGILPGYFGYETGQAAVGDAFDWFRQAVGHKKFDQLNKRAAAIAPGAEGVLCMDWFNGCRTPLMDGTLKGAFTGLTLNHGPEHLYRALLEASGFGVRWIVDLLQDSTTPKVTIWSANKRTVQRFRPSGVLLQAKAIRRASATPSNLRARFFPRLPCSNPASKPRSTKRTRSRSTVRSVQSKASATAASLQPGPSRP